MGKISTQHRHVPQLRFKEFSNRLRDFQLGELFKYHSGGTPSKDNPKFWNGNIPWITASSMRGNYFNDSEYKVTKEAVGKGTRVVQAGTLLLLVRGSILFKDIPVGITQREVAFNQDVKALLPKDKQLNISYFLFWFLANKNRLLHKVTGTGIGAGKLDIGELETVIASVPDFNEQNAIAMFLTKVDFYITNLKTQKTKLEEYKRGMMQKIFSQDVRFKGEGGKHFPMWKTKKLGELFNEKTDRATNGDYELLSITLKNGVTKYDTAVKKDGSSDDKSNYKVVHVGDIAYNTMRMWQGASGVSKYEGIVSPAYTVVSLKDGDTDYFAYLFKHPRTIFDFYRYSQGLVSDTWNLKYAHFKEVKVTVPVSKEEQIKIRKFLQSIDELIQFKSEQIVKAEMWKKGLLQKMFV